MAQHAMVDSKATKQREHRNPTQHNIIMSNNHLSELSVQLRKLQNENNAQANEIDRLERQIRILSELKGISIHEIRDALRVACEGEAHGELRSVVGKLQAKVDSAGLDNSRGLVRKDFAPQDNSRARLALELRVGELEELENTLRADLSSLYQQVARLTENNTTLKTENLQQKARLEEWERRWRAKEEEEVKKGSIVAVPMASTGSYNYSDFTAVNTQVSLADQQNRLVAAETALAGEKEQKQLLQSQMESTNKSYELKIDQYQHRIQFLEGQLNDLEQQMNSLYVAFGMMSVDRTKERESSLMWKNNLLQSDAALAKEESEKEKQQQQPPPPTPPSDNQSMKQSKIPIRPGHSSYSTSNNGVSLPSIARRVSTPQASVKPAVHPPIIQGHLLLLLDNLNQPLLPQANVASSTSQSKRKLLLKTPSQRRRSSSLGLKKQYCVLHGSNGLYQLRYGDTYTGSVAGVHEFLTTGVSSIEHTERSSRFDYGFEIVINPNAEDSLSLCCAAESEEVFMRWMAALMGVIDDNQGSEC
jgi:predicted  nucleic acid-binding Zn-ribbon protein